MGRDKQDSSASLSGEKSRSISREIGTPGIRRRNIRDISPHKTKDVLVLTAGNGKSTDFSPPKAGFYVFF